uniref:Uncharacterized protein n=1 Tax=Arundo donax TaxID=35708 RepID=A0A0A9EY60_ARUDO
MTVVRFVMTLSRASCTILSDSVSKALVASSNNRILGSLRIALAMAILCFCPPESCVPCSPTEVAKPWGILSMNLDALASSAAALISSLVALSLP